jgi:branched-subunit amino acid transport protein
MSIWITIILAGLATYAIRLSFIQAYGRRRIPDGMARSLRFVPPAVLTAIIIPELLNVMLTVVAGMAVLWALQLIF